MNSRLAPPGSFPDDLAALGDFDLQVLHSRFQSQLEHEYASELKANLETEFRYAGVREGIEQREFVITTWEPRVRLTAGR